MARLNRKAASTHDTPLLPDSIAQNQKLFGFVMYRRSLQHPLHLICSHEAFLSIHHRFHHLEINEVVECPDSGGNQWVRTCRRARPELLRFLIKWLLQVTK